MAWLEIKIDTLCQSINAVAAALTAGGFEDLVLEDQQEFEAFLDENRAYWDYIDEQLQQKLQGLSCIKLYLEDTDSAGLARLNALLDKLRQTSEYGSLTVTVSALEETNWEESWKDNYPPQQIGQRLVCCPTGWQMPARKAGCL